MKFPFSFSGRMFFESSNDEWFIYDSAGEIAVNSRIDKMRCDTHAIVE